MSLANERLSCGHDKPQLEAAVRRAVALLNRASSDWRSSGGDTGPLHWPTAIALAVAELRGGLASLEPEQAERRSFSDSYVGDQQNQQEGHVPSGHARHEAGETFPGCERLAREIDSGATATGERTIIPADTAAGMAWWNNLTPSRRREWLDAAGSAVAADAWRAFQSGMREP